MPKLKKTGIIHNALTGYDFRIDEPLKLGRAVREKCLECVCCNAAEVARCHIFDCTLWPFRQGKRPDKPKRVLSEAQRERAARQLASVRRKTRAWQSESTTPNQGDAQ